MPTTSASRIIAAPLADVWAAITDLEAAAHWNAAWQRVEYLSSWREGVGTTFRSHTEDGQTFDFQISEWEPMKLVTFEPLQDEPEEGKRYLITLQSQSFMLKPAGDDRTDVTLFATVKAHGLRGWLTARFVWPNFQRQGLRSALDNLQALYEPLAEDAKEDERESGG